MLAFYLISNTNPTFGRPPGRLIGGVWGADAPPGIKSGFVFSQSRASIGALVSYSESIQFMFGVYPQGRLIRGALFLYKLQQRPLFRG